MQIKFFGVKQISWLLQIEEALKLGLFQQKLQQIIKADFCLSSCCNDNDG